ncbi:MAG: tetratricopeptide repeat protein [Phycisphaeraceae bacterium]|nr:tetratricopeptide repeat protein [Phycisphaeraceae bacterium]
MIKKTEIRWGRMTSGLMHLRRQDAWRRLAWGLGMMCLVFVSGRASGSSPAPDDESGLLSQAQTAALKQEELALVESLVKAFPDREASHVLLGSVLERHGRTIEAVTCWQAGIKLNPRRASLYCHLGRITLGKGQYDQAIQYYQKAVELDWAVPSGFTGWSLALMGAGRQREAREVLQKGLGISPDLAFGHELIAKLYLQDKAYDKSRAHYETAIRLEPDTTSAHYGLMSVYTRLKQPVKAQAHRATFKRLKAQEMKVLKEKNEAANDLRLTRSSVANTYASAETFHPGPSKLGLAHKLLTRGLAIDPNSMACLEHLGSLYSSSGRLDNALATFKRAAEVDPNRLIYVLNVGLIASRLGRFDEAEEAFGKAMVLAPQSSAPFRELARLYLQAGKQVPRSLDLANKALALEKTAENYYVMAWACGMNGEAVLSLAALEKAMQLAPDNMRYKQAYEQAKKRH